MVKLFCRMLYRVVLVLGVHAAYDGNLAAALFFAIVFASENIGISIDYWPRLKIKGWRELEQALKDNLKQTSGVSGKEPTDSPRKE